MKLRKADLVLLIFTLYGINHYIFERGLFFNELLSVIGLLFFVKYSFRGGGRILFPREVIYRSVLALMVLFLVYAVVSLGWKTNWYYYLRNLSIIYPIFTFFIGFHLYPYQAEFLERTRKWIYGFALFSFFTAIPNLIDRNAFMYWLALIQKDWRIKGLLILVTLSVLYLLAYTSLTVAVILALLVGLLIVPRFWIFASLAFLGLVAFAFIFIEATPYLKLYRHNSQFLFGNVHYVYAHHPWFQIDHNTSWRMVLWYRSLVELFPKNLIGIGVGTPIIPYLPAVNTTGLPYSDEHLAHVIGAHNTFISIFVRFGIVSLALIFLIYYVVLREFYDFRTYYRANRNDFALFVSFLTISIVGLFNVVIETPTLAAVFWVSLGFVSRAVYSRKNNNTTAPTN
ncbi:MAG: O-antigen ligase family protein [Cyclobacteriaceae bacterium]